MRIFIKPSTVHILGGTQQTGNQSEYQADCQEQPDSKPSGWKKFKARWKKFKAKAKHAWDSLMSAAEDIKDNIIPIVTGVGTFLISWATFCNRTRSNDRQWGTSAWAW